MHVEAAAKSEAAAAPAAAGAADGLVAVEDAAIHRQHRAIQGEDAAAGADEGGAVGRAGVAGAADGLVAGEAAAVKLALPKTITPPPMPWLLAKPARHGSAEGLVAAKGGAADGRGPVHGKGAAVGAGVDAVAAGDTDGLVVREGTVGKGENAIVVDRRPLPRCRCPGAKPSNSMNGFVVPFTEPMAWLPMNVVRLMMAVAGSGPLMAEPPTFSRAPLATRARLLLNTSFVM